MKKISLFILIIILLISCSIRKPEGFTNYYDGLPTGLGSLINIDGYYYSSKINIALLFYRDGISIRSGVRDSSLLINIFSKGTGWSLSKGVPTTIYGRYIISHDTIVNQRIYHVTQMGTKSILEQYIIKSKSELYSVEDRAVFKFYPLENRMDSTTWLLKKKWFWNKEAWENRNK